MSRIYKVKVTRTRERVIDAVEVFVVGNDDATDARMKAIELVDTPNFNQARWKFERSDGAVNRLADNPLLIDEVIE